MRGCPFDDIFKRIVREVPLGYRWILIEDIKTTAENRLKTFKKILEAKT